MLGSYCFMELAPVITGLVFRVNGPLSWLKYDGMFLADPVFSKEVEILRAVRKYSSRLVGLFR